MNATYKNVRQRLKEDPQTWLVTGVAGFIGSSLLERLLELHQAVIGIDNFITGSRSNLEQVQSLVSKEQWDRFTFIEGDIRNLDFCQDACRGVHYILHHAALGSVPRSIMDPLIYNEINITGTLNMLIAARDKEVKRFVYASSSSVYGDHPILPKKEDVIGKLLSPYAVTKYIGELYADVFSRTYGMETIGLRYFNVFGPRQNPGDPYAAVIPKWIAGMINGETIYINGNGETTRDFCFVENVVQINLLAAVSRNPEAINQVYNVALDKRASLNNLFTMIRERLVSRFAYIRDCEPIYRDFRDGDIMHSRGGIEKAQRLLLYAPTHTIDQGLDAVIYWYITSLERRN